MLGGYMGRILNVDLATGKTWDEPLDEDLARDYVGGYGLGVRLLYERVPAGTDPLGPENILGFLSGPLTGTQAIEGNRSAVVCKSPLTHTWGDANCGGAFGPHLKFAGYDGVLLHGVAETPAYLTIIDGKAELHDASHLWGLDTNAAEDALQNQWTEGRQRAQVACIGPAGEKLALISGIIHDKGRTWGRSGVGAVMGSKRLKAVVVRGQAQVPQVDPDRAKELRRHHSRNPAPEGRYDYFSTTGTVGGNGPMALSGRSPVKNWGGTTPTDFPQGPEAYDPDRLIGYQTRKYGCWRCTLACGGHMEVPEDTGSPWAGTEHHKVEYETGWAFGTMTLNEDFFSLIKCNELCNRYGLDSISAGCTTAFAMECFEHGLLTPEDTGGIELTWGDAGAVVAVLELMGKREGLGDVLADGVEVAAERIGQGAGEFAIHIHGQELPGHHPVFIPELAVSYQMDATPARHTQAHVGYQSPGMDLPQHDQYEFLGEATSTRIKALSEWMHFINATGLCLFGSLSYHWSLVPEFMAAVTGEAWSLERILKAGERIHNLRHAFNLREGLNPIEFKVPGRVLGDPPYKDGNVRDVTVPAREMVREYCEQVRWDPVTARPAPELLQELGLEFVAKDIGV